MINLTELAESSQPQETPKESQEIDIDQVFGPFLAQLENSFLNTNQAIEALATRLALVEKYIEYLMLKDPDIKKNMEEHAKAQENQEVK
jgi:hypothetical protein